MSEHILAVKMKERFGDAVSDDGLSLGHHVFRVNADAIVDVCQFLKDDPELRFDFLSDLSGVDYLSEEPRFEVVYHLYSLPFKRRVRLKCRIGEPPRILSVVGVWRTANWHEREAYDMYGIEFDGHPDLRRIYMADDFEGYPLRKDFPVKGYKDEYNPFGDEGSLAAPAPEGKETS